MGWKVKEGNRTMNPDMGTHAGLSEARALVKMLDERLGRLELSGLVPSAGGPSGEARLDQLADFAVSLLAATTVEAVLERALEHVGRLVKVERTFLTLQATEKSFVDRIQSTQKQDGNLWAVEKLARQTTTQVIESKRPAVVVDASTHPAFADDVSAYEIDMGGLACLPLMAGDQLVGALYVDRKKADGPFTPVDLKLLDTLTSITARALLSARTLEEANSRRQHLEMLNKLYRTISRTLELDQLLQQISQITLEVTQAERAFVLLLYGGQLRVVAARDQEGPLPAQAGRELSRSVCEKVLKTQQGVYVFDTASDAEFSAKLSVVSLKLNSVVAVPLKGQSGMTGLLYIDSKTKAMAGLEKELEVLTAIANVASMAVDNAKLFRQATLDGLTGLYVRSFFMVRMEEEALRASRYGRVFSLIVLDIDHFKKFNDTYGHQTGDEVIKLVSGVVKAIVRTGVDIPGRYGGEELVVLLPETDTAGAKIVAERLREGVESASLMGPKQAPLNVTVSVGVATFPAVAQSPAELFDRADQALYQSKQGGRNRVTVYQPS